MMTNGYRVVPPQSSRNGCVQGCGPEVATGEGRWSLLGPDNRYLPGTVPSLAGAVAELRSRKDELWDADPTLLAEVVRSRPPLRFAAAVHHHDPVALRWLTYHVARRALPCWELSCTGQRPRKVVDLLGEHLAHGAPVDWAAAMEATPSECGDCRFSDTQSASDAVAQCAEYLHRGDPLYAGYCLSSADVAYAHVLTDHQFCDWLLDVAIPVSLEHREMTEAERDALRPEGWREMVQLHSPSIR